MPWTWRYEDASGAQLDEPAASQFPSQAEAESWLGESWRELHAAGVAAVVLLEDARPVYGPMSLESAN